MYWTCFKPIYLTGMRTPDFWRQASSCRGFVLGSSSFSSDCLWTGIGFQWWWLLWCLRIIVDSRSLLILSHAAVSFWFWLGDSFSSSAFWRRGRCRRRLVWGFSSSVLYPPEAGVYVFCCCAEYRFSPLIRTEIFFSAILNWSSESQMQNSKVDIIVLNAQWTAS